MKRTLPAVQLRCIGRHGAHTTRSYSYGKSSPPLHTLPVDFKRMPRGAQTTLNQIQCTASHVRIEINHRICHQTPHLLGLGRRLFGFLHLGHCRHLHRGTTGLVSSLGFLGRLGVLSLLGLDLGLAAFARLRHCFGFWTQLFLGGASRSLRVPPVLLG